MLRYICQWQVTNTSDLLRSKLQLKQKEKKITNPFRLMRYYQATKRFCKKRSFRLVFNHIVFYIDIFYLYLNSYTYMCHDCPF